MEEVLVVVDMQGDFIDGSLGTNEAKEILPRVLDRIQEFQGRIYFTRDSHGEDYLSSVEGKHLPIKHCIMGTEGWELHPDIRRLSQSATVIDKETFGSKELADQLLELDKKSGIGSITLMGLCTDICVISNALLLKAYLPEVEIRVDSQASAGVSPESHQRALEAMKVCHIEII